MIFDNFVHHCLFWDSVVNFSVLSRQRHLDLEDVLHVNDQAT
jgi:hypothetical protein